MKIDNKRNIYRIWIRKLSVTILFTIFIIALIFLNILNKPEDTFTKYHIAIVISVIYIIVSVLGAAKNPYYFSMNITPEMIHVRYYPVSLFNARKNSIQIPIANFLKFESKKFFLGREEKIIIYQNYRQKIAKYPPISLSGLSRAEQKQVKEVLRKFSKE